MTQRHSQRTEAPETPSSSDAGIQKYRTIRLSVLIGTALVLAIGGGILYFWHDYQKKRGSEALLAQADDLVRKAAEKDPTGSYADAASLLFRYTQIQPGDSDAQIKLAEIYEKSVSDAAGVRRATSLLYEAIGLADGARQNQLRRSLVQLLLRQGAYLEAATESEKLVSSGGNEADKADDEFANVRLRALALFGRYQGGDIAGEDFARITGELVAALRRAVAIDPDPELVEPLTYLLEADDPRLEIQPVAAASTESINSDTEKQGETEKEKPQPLSREQRTAEAASLVDRMVTVRPDDPMAYLVRFHYWQQQQEGGQPSTTPDFAKDLARAVELGPDNVTVRLYAGNSAYEVALDILRANHLESLPSPSEMPPDLPAEQKTALEQARQQFQVAASHYQHVLDHIDASNATALLGLGRSSIALSEPDQAAALWRSALAEPREDQLAFHFYLAQLEVQRQNWAAAKTDLDDLDKDLEKLNLRSDRMRFEPLRRTVGLMRARTLMANEQFAAALRLLERVVAGQPTSEVETTEQSQAYRLAGLCHERLGRPDMAARALENSARLATKPALQAVAYAAAAEAWESSSAIENALAAANQAAKLDPTPEMLLLQARLLAAQQASLPQTQQKWDRFNEAIEKLGEAETAGQLTAGWRLQLLQADAQVFQASNAEQAEAALENVYQTARRAEQTYPEDQALLNRLIMTYENLRRPEDADRALQQFQSVTTDPYAQKLMEARLQLQRRQFPDALACLEALPANLPNTQRAEVAKTRARILAANGQAKEAADLLKTLAKDFPEDLTLARLRLELVDQLQDTQAREELEAELLGGTQEDKSWAQVLRIQRLSAAAKSDRDPGFLEALDMIGRLETARPEWSVVYSLRGAAEEKRASFANDEEQQRAILELAARAYERAVSLGDRTLVAQERLINTLYRAGRFSDAMTCLDRIDRTIPLSRTLSEIAINIAMEGNRLDQAVAVARRAMEMRPNDMMARAWYGLVQLNAGQLDEAQRVLLEAVQAAPQDDQAWNGLFTYYVRTDDKVKAHETLDKMLAQANMSPERRAFVKAQALESLADDAQADTAYREAFRDFPDNERIRTRLAQFYMNRIGSSAFPSPPAIAVLQDIVARYPQDILAKRTLVAVLARSGGDEYRAALRMLDSGSGQDVMDRRMQAYLLFQRDGLENLAAAKKIVESIVDTPAAEPDDHLLLVRILERQGDTTAARDKLAQLSRQQPPNLLVLSAYVDLLIQQKDSQEAEQAFARLEQAAGATFNIGVLEIKAKLLVAQGQPASVQAQIDPVIQQQYDALPVGQKAAKMKLAGQAGDLYARLDLYAPAENWYRRLLELNPEQIAPLATCLAKTGRLSDALSVCEAALARLGAPTTASTVADVLTAGKSTSADYERAEPILSAALQAAANNPALLLSVANVRLVQGRLDDAVTLLEKIVQLDSKNILALNNLAMILSERPEQRAKALQYIDQALDITGPRPDLYDTKAAILLYDNQPEKAVDLLEFAARSDAINPVIQFHLAAAYFGTKKLEQAATLYRAAIDAGLENQVLTQSDRQLMTSMQDLLKSQ